MQPFHWIFFPLIILDLIMLGHSVDLLVRAALFGANISALVTNLNICHLKELNAQMGQLIGKHRRLGRPIGANSIPQLGHFLREHTAICVCIPKANQELFGPAALGSIVFNIPTNIALFTRLAFQELEPTEIAITWAFIIGQYVSTMMCFASAATQLNYVHSAHKYLPGLLCRLHPSLLSYKLKLNTVYERITYGPKYGITVGPQTEALTHPFIHRVNETFIQI